MNHRKYGSVSIIIRSMRSASKLPVVICLHYTQAPAPSRHYRRCICPLWFCFSNHSPFSYGESFIVAVHQKRYNNIRVRNQFIYGNIPCMIDIILFITKNVFRVIPTLDLTLWCNRLSCSLCQKSTPSRSGCSASHPACCWDG